tara:strand:+ start:81 stop:386 length:306 start_codon:yes stop_codon:yes gene_type:complete
MKKLDKKIYHNHIREHGFRSDHPWDYKSLKEGFILGYYEAKDNNVTDALEDTERKELLDCIHNFIGFFDNPIARMKMKSADCEEVRQIGRDIMKKYNISTK